MCALDQHEQYWPTSKDFKCYQVSWCIYTKMVLQSQPTDPFWSLLLCTTLVILLLLTTLRLCTKNHSGLYIWDGAKAVLGHSLVLSVCSGVCSQAVFTAECVGMYVMVALTVVYGIDLRTYTKQLLQGHLILGIYVLFFSLLPFLPLLFSFLTSYLLLPILSTLKYCLILLLLVIVHLFTEKYWHCFLTYTRIPRFTIDFFRCFTSVLAELVLDLLFISCVFGSDSWMFAGCFYGLIPLFCAVGSPCLKYTRETEKEAFENDLFSAWMSLFIIRKAVEMVI